MPYDEWLARVGELDVALGTLAEDGHYPAGPRPDRDVFSRRPPSLTTYVDARSLTTYIVTMEIADSARKHGISDEDILHAVAHPVAPVAVRADRIFFIGTTQTGELLEIVVLSPDEEPAVIHADICRPKFYRYI